MKNKLAVCSIALVFCGLVGYGRGEQRDALQPVNVDVGRQQLDDGSMKVVPPGKMPNCGIRLKPGQLGDLYDRVERHFFADAAYVRPDNGGKFVDADGFNAGWNNVYWAAYEGRMAGMAAAYWRWTGDVRARQIAERYLAQIHARQQADGYYGYYPSNEVYACLDLSYKNERKNYDRSFWTQGLLLAHEAGFPLAGKVLRGMYDWLNGHDEYLKTILVGPNTPNSFPSYPRLALSSLGTAADRRVLEKYYNLPGYQELCARGDETLFLAYPHPRTHVYILLVHESFLLRYLLTGREELLHAAQGAWKVFRECYKLPGGLSTICEHGMYPPRSFRLGTVDTSDEYSDRPCVCGGETCGQVFWTQINGHFQELFPNDARYAAEIEEQLVNALPASRDSRGWTHYHNFPEGRSKDVARDLGSCCETSSGLFLSDLPRYLFLSERDGIRINQFFATDWSNEFCSVSLESRFPDEGRCRLRITRAAGRPFVVNIRVPSWVEGEIQFTVNGETVARVGRDAYFACRREWKAGDQIAWEFPMTERKVRYRGWNEIPGKVRYAHFKGPVLLARRSDGTTCPYWSLEPNVPFTCFWADEERLIDTY